MTSISPCTGLPKVYSAATVPVIGSFTSAQSFGSVAFTSYFGSTYSSTRTSSCVARLPFTLSPTAARSFQTPRFGSVESGRSSVVIPKSSVVMTFLKTLIPFASCASTVAVVATGRRFTSSATTRMRTVCPGL